MNIKEALLGGPGLDGYAYQADVYCVPCGQTLTEAVFKALNQSDIPSPLSGDSEVLPQPVFFGESDTAQVCGKCGKHLYGPNVDK